MTQRWIDRWNRTYRATLADLTHHLGQINARLGYEAVRADPVEGGWYLPLRLAPALLPGTASSVDAFAALLHYDDDSASGIALLPGELFGRREMADRFMLRGTLAVSDGELHRFTIRLSQAVTAWSGPDGPELTRRALKRARTVADLDLILANTRY